MRASGGEEIVSSEKGLGQCFFFFSPRPTSPYAFFFSSFCNAFIMDPPFHLLSARVILFFLYVVDILDVGGYEPVTMDHSHITHVHGIKTKRSVIMYDVYDRIVE